MSAPAYSYTANPRAVPVRAGRYRDEAQAKSIMSDKRIVRGNTYAAQVIPANAQEEAKRLQQQQAAEQRRRELRMQQEMLAAQQPRSPEPVFGRQHAEAQTENYLEELTDRPPEVEAAVQTDPFLDRPRSPIFVPAKIGVDAYTQIEDGDLFDFDMEVSPILEVLVGKTLEQAMLEVLEEEELAAIRKHKEAFRQRRNAELAEVQRLEAEELRREDEKSRRVQQQAQRAEFERRLRDKVAARAFAKQYMASMHDRVFSSLAQEGHFYDPLRREVEELFVPWVMDHAARRVDGAGVARRLADAVLRGAVELQQRRRQEHLADVERRRREAEEQEAERRRREAAEEEARLKAEREAEEGDGEGEGEEEDA